MKSLLLLIFIMLSCGKAPVERDSTIFDGEVINGNESNQITDKVDYKAFSCRDISGCSSCFRTNSQCVSSCSQKSSNIRSICNSQCSLIKSSCVSDYCDSICRDNFIDEEKINECKSYCRTN